MQYIFIQEYTYTRIYVILDHKPTLEFDAVPSAEWERIQTLTWVKL